ncbi:MAG: 3-keto-steroid reductase [Trichoglossum hirsutum]|nr:MAG: 3-keto-steroid reductase [Trichoglossum hirsutum]
MRASESTPGSQFHVLITGANSGLGFTTCCRIIDEFLDTRREHDSITLVFTTRDSRKGDSTIARLQKHVNTLPKSKRPDGTARVSYQAEIVALDSLLSVQRLSRKLLTQLPKLDVIILNAGYGGWTGVDYWMSVRQSMSSFIQSVTWPTYKLSNVGVVTKPQLPPRGPRIRRKQSATYDSDGEYNEPPLGEVFCINVFGHYLLSHNLSPLLSNAYSFSGERGRIIWVSSVEAEIVIDAFSIDDIQCLTSPQAYEISKRLTDVLALTSRLPAAKPWVDSFLSAQKPVSIPESDGRAQIDGSRPRMYVAHPGICSTEILPVHWILSLLKIMVFYIARWLGSPWHTIDPYKGACASVWVALSPQEQLDDIEAKEGPGKWGSSTDMWGNERVRRTEVSGWGWGGVVGERTQKAGRISGAKALTQEAREEFEGLGRKCWRQMEGLREEWEERLDELD